MRDIWRQNAELKSLVSRPGEKLHETMISVDDARTTFDMGDRYVILPAEFQAAKYAVLLQNSKMVPKDFCYSSDLNSEWMSESDFHKTIDKP